MKELMHIIELKGRKFYELQFNKKMFLSEHLLQRN